MYVATSENNVCCVGMCGETLGTKQTDSFILPWDKIVYTEYWSIVGTGIKVLAIWNSLRAYRAIKPKVDQSDGTLTKRIADVWSVLPSSEQM